MKKSPLVSVIIPCHNYGKYLPQSIKSVLDQTYENIELTILDDGSTDSTKTVARKYAAKHPNVKYLHQPNKGIVETRNRCLKEVNGKYLIMLDADDYLDKNYVEETVKIAEESSTDIVYTNFKTFGLENKKSDFPMFSLEELKNHNFIHISALLKTKTAKKFKFDPYLDKKSHEDWDYFLNMALHGADGQFCKNTFLNYRIHSDGRNNVISTIKQRSEYISVYKYVISKYQKNFHKELRFLIGRVFADWYEEVNHKLNLQKRHNKKIHRILIEKDQELIAIKRSKTWRLRNKLAKFIGREKI